MMLYINLSTTFVSARRFLNQYKEAQAFMQTERKRIKVMKTD